MLEPIKPGFDPVGELKRAIAKEVQRPAEIQQVHRLIFIELLTQFQDARLAGEQRSQHVGSGKGKERVTNLLEYLQRFSDAVDYDYFRAIGLLIGSGEVESAIAVYSPKAPQDSRSYLASRYHQSHASRCVSFELTIGGRMDGLNKQPMRLAA